MLLIRKQFIDIETVHKDIFVHFNFDTNRLGFINNFKRAFKNEMINSKPWVGEVNIYKKKFEISRTGVGTFKSNVSSIVIRGEEVMQGNRKQLKLSYGVSNLSFIFSLFSLIPFTIFMVILLQGLWGLAVMLCIVIVNVLLTILEVNKSEAYMTDYLNSLISTLE
ncbi:MAG: hypothetical protein HOP30_13695 [Cyclobacteriaceae bacterium]|nr:hypothetical protein [Cyclobacteriaceae bacterium]